MTDLALTQCPLKGHASMQVECEKMLELLSSVEFQQMPVREQELLEQQYGFMAGCCSTLEERLNLK